MGGILKDGGIVQLVISLLALVLSGLSVWFTIFHRGTVKMSRPQFFALLPEDGPFGGWLKFFVRVLLFSSGRRGRVVEKLYVTLKHEGKSFPLLYWMYGKTEALEIGSGVFVGHEGLAANHHFVPTSALTIRDLTPGNYDVDVHACLLGDNNPLLLQTIQFELGKEEAAAICGSKDKAVFFVWDQELRKYKSRIDTRRSRGRSSSVSGSGGGSFSWEGEHS